MSNVSAHFCPLVRVGSAAPFTATEVEEGVVATAATNMEKLTTVSCLGSAMAKGVHRRQHVLLALTRFDVENRFRTETKA